MRSVSAYIGRIRPSLGISLRPVMALFGFFLVLSLYAASAELIHKGGPYELFPPFIPDWNLYWIGHLGGEYRSIAHAILAGRGFSDPFVTPTGPTAWMPPLFPIIIAGLLTTFGTGRALVVAVAVLQDLVWISAGIAIFLTARRSARRLSPWVALGAYALLVIALFRWFFQFSHDHVIVMVAVLSLWTAGLIALRQEPLRWSGFGWGVLGGISCLVAPVTAIPWATGGIFLLRAGKLPLRALLRSVAFFALTLLPWTCRNYLVFGELIPVKSNLFFDIYFSTEVSRTGVLSEGLWEQHPIKLVGKKGTSEYEALGEREFLHQYRTRAVALLRENPRLYLKKTFNRLLAMTVLYYPYNSHWERRTIWFTKAVWWIPFAGLVITLALGSVYSLEERRLQRFTALFYASYLLPYLLVSYYVRYSIPLTAFSALFAFWGIEGLARIWARGRSAEPPVTPGDLSAS